MHFSRGARASALILLALTTVHCQATDEESADTPRPEARYAAFGATITPDGATALDAVLPDDSLVAPTPVKVTATITEMCQNKGCWMRLSTAGDDDILVTFKDYGFFVPKDASGREVILEGSLQKMERSVEVLRHLARDAGQSDDLVAAITEPEMALTIEATGVLIREPGL